MNIDVIATVLTGVGVLFGVWKMTDGMRRELHDDLQAVRLELNAKIDAVNQRIDAVLLADRKPM